jgi:hypothetical protein
MTVAVNVAAVVIALSILLSTILFGVEVFIKQRGMEGQVIGFVFSIIALPLYLIAFADRLPGDPSSLRNILLIIPGVTQSSVDFSSSLVILLALVVTYALRLGIYTRLFIIPALTMTEEEYHSRDQVEQRANDLSAPVLAYLTFALIVTAIIAGVYSLPAAVGALVWVLLMVIYFGSSYLRHLRNSLIWLAVQFRIMVRQFWLYASTLVVATVLVMGYMESWRRRQQPGDERFFENLADRLRESQRKAKAKIDHERELLRNLAANQERV